MLLFYFFVFVVPSGTTALYWDFYSVLFPFSQRFFRFNLNFSFLSIFFLAAFHLSISPGSPRLAMLAAGEVILYLINCKSIKINCQQARDYSSRRKNV